MRQVFWSAFALGFSLVAGAANAATVEQWRQDIDKIVADVKATHPNPFAKTGELTFLRAAEALKIDLPSLSEEQRMARAMALVSLVGDGHTQLFPNNPAFARWYPFRLYEFSDGYFFTGVHNSAAELVGAQLLEVGGRPVEQAVGAARKLMGFDNRYDSMERLYAFHNAALMTGLGLAGSDGALRVKLKLSNGRKVDRVVPAMTGESSSFDWSFRPEYWGPVGTPDDWLSAYQGLSVARLRTLDLTRPAHLQYRRAFHAAALPGGKVYYIQNNVVGGTSEESLPAFFRRALGEVDRLKPDHLIVDLRHNFGGDGSNVFPVIHQFIRRKDNAPWKNLYLLTGRKTFSAAVLMTDAFLDHLRPTVVGEPAGAPLNTYGDANAFDFSATGMRLFVSFERHEKGKSTDLRDIIPVDYPARFSFADYRAGRDPAVDAIVNGEEVRSIPAIAAADGAAVAFSVYQTRQAKFGSDESWAPTSEIDLRTIMRELSELGRTGAAIEVARLNTQINPQEWRTWMNLGDLHMAAGQKASAIENYRRSVQLNDPTNFNADRLRRAIEESEKLGPMPSGSPAILAVARRFEAPGVITFGATTADLQRDLASLCPRIRTRKIDPPFLPDVKTQQLQIDCDGFQFRGRGRHVEFVIRDDRLVMVWLMVEPAEGPQIIRDMKEALGPPTGENKNYVAFERHRTAWRHKPAEILFYAPELDADMKPDFR